MALTAQGARLTEAHRATQAKQAALIAALVSRYWNMTIDLEDIDGSAARWVEFVLPYILRSNGQSATLARQYVQAFRAIELGLSGSNGLEFKPTPIEALTEDAIRASLWATGPAELKKKIAAIEKRSEMVKLSGLDVPASVDEALIRSASAKTGEGAGGSAVRQVLNGGREQIYSATAEDKTALGYLRVTDGDPCYFCMMLLSRGPVYEDDSFDQSDPRFHGPGNAKCHDHCACNLEPVYGRRTEWPGRAREAEALWKDSKNLKDFRSKVDNLRRESLSE